MQKENFVSLNCESCGAPVPMGINQKNYTCKFCGRTFVYKNPAGAPQTPRELQRLENEQQLAGDDW